MSRLIVHGKMRFGLLQKSTGLTAGNLATHIDVLARAGYVEQQRAEEAVVPTKTIALTARGEDSFRAYAEKLKSFLATLDAAPK